MNVLSLSHLLKNDINSQPHNRIQKMQHHVTRSLGKNKHTRNTMDSRRTDRSHKHRQFTIEDVCRGLRKMVEGNNAKKTVLYTQQQGQRVPFML